MTWNDLLALEPGLMLLERDIGALRRRARRQSEFCAHAAWYRPGGLKARLRWLVGWSARHPKLRTSEAYDVAYQHLYGLLPHCRGCGPYPSLLGQLRAARAEVAVPRRNHGTYEENEENPGWQPRP